MLAATFLIATSLVASAGVPWKHSPAASGIASGESQPDKVGEYRVKAAFLYNFIRYTTWPSDSFENEKSPLVVLVVGGNPFGKHLERALTDKSIGGRPIALRLAKDVTEVPGAHLVFDGGLPAAQRAKLLTMCRTRPTIVVGERSGFAAAGAHINFFLAGSKVRFEVNVDAVRASRLELSSQVLKLARIVREKGRPR